MGGGGVEVRIILGIRYGSIGGIIDGNYWVITQFSLR